MEQFNILDCPLEGSVLIEASAGTGKTHAITGLYLRLIVERSLQPEQILVVTFTEAATEELRGRIRARLRGLLEAGGAHNAAVLGDPLLDALAARCREDRDARMRVQTALRGFDEAAVYTIHGFCHRMLMDYAFESAALFDTELVTGDAELVRILAVDYLRKNLYREETSLLAEYAAFEKSWARVATFTGLYRSCVPGARVHVAESAEGISAGDVEHALGAARAAYDCAASMWKTCGGEVRAIIADALARKDLNGNRYRNHPAKLDLLEGYLSGSHPLEESSVVDLFAAQMLAAHVNKGGTAPEHDFFRALDRLSDARLRARGLLDAYLQVMKRDFIAYAQREIMARKRAQNTRSFDDLLTGMHDALKGNESSFLARSVRSRYAAALIDEFQDTDPVQYSIFTTLFSAPESILFLIGDPKQAVYAFRGADIFAYMEASRGVTRRYTLGVNWRSSPDFVKASHALFDSHPNPFVFGEIALPAVSAADREKSPEFSLHGKGAAPLVFWCMDDGGGKGLTDGEALAVAAGATAEEITRLLSPGSGATIDGRPVQPSDIAVLVRAHYQGERVHAELARRRVPAVRYGSGSVFETRDAVEFFTILCAAASPSNEALVKAALATDAAGMDALALAEAMEDERAWDQVIARFHEYRALWERRGFMHMFRAFMERESVHRNLVRLPDGERRLTNFLHLGELLHCAGAQKGLGIDGAIKWFTGMKEGRPGADDQMLRLETDEEAVKIITLHRSKGLEFPIVFCTFTWDSPGARNDAISYHDPDDGNRMVLSLEPGDERAALVASRERIAEEMRLLYVGVTRARHRCYLTWGGIKDSHEAPLAYLVHGKEAAKEYDVCGAMKRIMENAGTAGVDGALKALASKVPGMRVETVPGGEALRYRAARLEGSLPRHRSFGGEIRRDWRISSFSALSAGAAHGLPERDHDAMDPPAQSTGRPVSFTNLYEFPRGAATGSFLHSIFENIDFTRGEGEWAPAIRDALRGSGMDGRWEPVLLKMVSRVMAAQIECAGTRFTLSSLPMKDRIAELEFLFPLGAITPGGLSEALVGSGIGNEGVKALLDEPMLEFEAHHGFLRGFIDLVFRTGGRYYLLDWKSNYLGDSPGDYARAPMEREMRRHRYDLQYMLYTVALHRFLSRGVGGYCYEDHFGGVVYMFLRGIDENAAPGCGIYGIRPGLEAVRRFESYLCGEG